MAVNTAQTPGNMDGPAKSVPWSPGGQHVPDSQWPRMLTRVVPEYQEIVVLSAAWRIRYARVSWS